MLLKVLYLMIINVNFICCDRCVYIGHNCDACMRNNFGCVWCTDNKHNGPRCRSRRKIIDNSSWCQNTIDPKNEAKAIKDEEFHHKTEVEEAVELKPQHVFVTSRPNTSVQFDMSYKPSLYRSIDMYYMFDNTKAMVIYRQLFDMQSSEIYKTFKDISEDLRFEVGLLGTNISSDNHEFSDAILVARVDVIETLQGDNSLISVLDALKLVLESKENAWLDGSRRIIVLFCDPVYTEDVLRFPASLAIDSLVREINRRAKESNVNIIFTGLKDYQELQINFAKEIEGSSYLVLKNVVNESAYSVHLAKILKEEYLELIHTLELDFRDLPSFLKLTITPPCEVFGLRCIRQVSQDEVILSMTAEVQMLRCPKDMKYRKTFEVKAIGVFDKWTIDALVNCTCGCSNKVEAHSHHCSSMGDYSCGVCNCYEGRYGVSCQLYPFAQNFAQRFAYSTPKRRRRLKGKVVPAPSG